MTSLYVTLYILLFMAVVLLAAIGSRAGGFLRSSKMRRPQISSLMAKDTPEEIAIPAAGNPARNPEGDAKEMDAQIDAYAAAMEDMRAEVGDMFTSPEILATILTILVGRYGDIRLTPEDFMISELDYVSIYVDNESEEIILSMDRDLDVEDIPVGVVIPDETTYH